MKIEIKYVIKLKSFVHGMAFYWAINSLYQDFLGKEEYIEKVRFCWIDSRITIPIAIIVLVLITVDLCVKSLKERGL